MSLHEFGAVDQAADPSTFVRYLDLVSQGDDLQQLKRRTYAALELQPGDRVLDVGCGTGEDVRAMAHLVGSEGWVVGVDSSVSLVDVATARTRGEELPCEFLVGEAEELDFRDGSFDACRAERVLQHVADPGRAVREMIRLLRPGGRMVCFEPDWDLQVFDAPDRELTRTICRFRSDQIRSGWVGRELRRYFLAGGLINVQAVPVMGVVATLAIADAAMGLRQMLQEATRLGVLTEDEATRWWTSLVEADREGRFFAASAAFLATGQKPAAHI